MKGTEYRGFLAGLLLAALLAVKAGAWTSLGEINWDTAGLQNWTEDESWLTLANLGSGGISNTGYLRYNLNEVDPMGEGMGEQWWALAWVPASNLFAGNWRQSGDMWLEFDFRAADVTPGYVQVQWAATNDRIWRSTALVSGGGSLSTQVWTHMQTTSLTDYQDWDYGGGTQQQFLDDLGEIDWIGVYIWRNTAVAQIYGIDRFVLLVPEPAEWMMLGTALITCFGACRRRRRQDKGHPPPAASPPGAPDTG